MSRNEIAVKIPALKTISGRKFKFKKFYIFDFLKVMFELSASCCIV